MIVSDLIRLCVI